MPGSYSYYMQIVPTKYHSAIGLAKEGFQYSVQQYFAPTTSVSSETQDGSRHQ